MTRIYRTLLRLYPRGYREEFGQEILRVFEQAEREHRTRGWGVYGCFLLTEFCGIVTGAARQWVIPRCGNPMETRNVELPDESQSRPTSELREAEERVAYSLKSMERAIASHDFTGARVWSFEDLKAREKLRTLRDRYGIDD